MQTQQLMLLVMKIAYPLKSQRIAPRSKVLSETQMSQSFTLFMEADLLMATIRKILTKLVSFRWFNLHAY